MAISIHLLGLPVINDATGNSHPVRGHQAWALLARVLLSDRPLSRYQLASELFPDTEDPLGSLRWCLASLRKALGSSQALTGDPLDPNLPEDVTIDALEIGSSDFDPGTADDLLSGVEPRCSPEFSTWLLVQRQHIARQIDESLRQKTMRSLSVGDYANAIRLAERAVRRNAFDERAHILLVKSLALAGRPKAALEHIEAVEKMFLKELGEKPTEALRSAGRFTISSPPAGVPSRSAARSLLDSGLAALAAGAADAGVECLRRAVTSAEHSGDRQLQAKTMFELGTALIHSVRGYDDEGEVIVQQSLELARDACDEILAASAYRELGYVEALAGRRPVAAAHLDAGLALTDDPETRAGLHSIIGFNLVDWGKPEEGLAHYRESLELARSVNNYRRQIWSLGIGARGRIALGEFETARDWLVECLALVDDFRWISFRPWPLALLAKAELGLGRKADEVRPQIEEAFALGCQLADPCWEGLAAQVMAHADMAVADYSGASQWLFEARRRCGRQTDIYVALQVEILGDMASLEQRLNRPQEADNLAREWLSLAVRSHMDSHVQRAARLIADIT